MKTSTSIKTSKLALALGGLLLLGAAPSFAQGVFQSPPSPNSGESMPQPPDSAPLSARTLAPGSTSQQRVGTVSTTRVEPAVADSSYPAASGAVVSR